MVDQDREPLSFLNEAERRVLGPLVRRLCATGNARFQRALETTGVEATVRMACVNALRLYAVALFMLGLVVKVAGLTPLAYPCFALAAAAMGWSFWCLYTVVGPEREFKRAHRSGAGAL